MKKIFGFISLISAILAFQACEVDHSYESTDDPVLSYYQIAGTWKLSEWKGANIGDDGRFFYMTLVSKDAEFTIWHNLDSARPISLTGTFTMEYDEDEGVNVISGIYDHEYGLWANDYIVTLKDADSMVWTSVSDPEDISVYIRAELPEDIQGI